MRRYILLFVSLTAFACSDPPSSYDPGEQFTKELIELKEYFQIPGISVIVKKGDQTLFEDYLGLADIEREIPMDSLTTIPMASLTKIFSSVIILQLAEEGKISLKDPIVNFIRDKAIPDSIKIEHALSHTSQGNVGQNFYYNNNRFMLLGEIIEKVSGQNFKTNIYNRIIEPLRLENTYLLEDSAQVADENWIIAKPYFLGGAIVDGFQVKEITDGFLDYGYSTAAGVTSTVRDLARFSRALDNRSLIDGNSTELMQTPYKPGLPYGLGGFTQEFMNEKLVWGYGQYDCYSSLFLKVPERHLTCVIAANNNLMSDPPHLIAGDVTYSLFALSFLKNFVLDLRHVQLLEKNKSLTKVSEHIDDINRTFYRKKLIAQSIAASFMSRFDLTESEKSKEILSQIFKTFPDHKSYADLVLLRNLYVLKFMDSMRGKDEFVQFDDQFRVIGQALLEADMFNPYANYYMANYYQVKGLADSTTLHYERILNARNFSPWWYTREAEKWLSQND